MDKYMERMKKAKESREAFKAATERGIPPPKKEKKRKAAEDLPMYKQLAAMQRKTVALNRVPKEKIPTNSFLTQP